MRKAVSAVFVIAFILSACSLKYEESVSVEESNPEFIFSNTKLTRYEDAKKTADIQADRIEQYKNSSESYAQSVQFRTYSEGQEEAETEGQCGILFTDTDKELYELFDDIKMYSRSNNAHFYADVLKWNAKSEQLTGSRTDTVRIEKDDTVIYGSGFSASGVSGMFEFSGAVSGEIEARTDKNQADEEALDAGE